MPDLIGGIEAGGTKFVCAVADLITGEIQAQTDSRDRSFLTGEGEAGRNAVLRRVVEWFHSQPGRIVSLGIGSFGPVDLRTGTITTTPKPGWANFAILDHFQNAFPSIKIAFDTDVNAAARGEQRWGAGLGCSDFVYITLGTGIGVGAVVNGALLHGLVHPEMGHMRLPRVPGDSFAGVCPYHGDCWEGLCSGPAIKARTGRNAADIPANDPAWEFVVKSNAFAIANIVCVLSPKRVIVGGSGRRASGLGEAAFFQRLRREIQTVLAGYVVAHELQNGIDRYIVPPTLGDDAGVRGAIALAMDG